MRARWEGLHAALIRSLTTWHADKAFPRARARHPVLARFESPLVLTAYLATAGGDLDEKDAIYADLVAAIQACTPWADIAVALVWCGLWPGLDAIYRRHLKHFAGETEEFVSLISYAFTALVCRLDLGRVRRIAATLVRSTEREVKSERRRTWTERVRAEMSRARMACAEARGACGLAFQTQVSELREWLVPVVGVDAELLLGVTVLDENRNEAAQRLGLAYQTARKRTERALARVRAHLDTAYPGSAW